MKSRVLLIAPPWQNPFLPSIQLGTLKPYVEREVPNVKVDIWSAFTAPAAFLPLPLITDFGRIVHVGELINLLLLFPGRHDTILKQLRRFSTLLEKNGISDIDKQVLDPFRANVERSIQRLKLEDVLLVGFTVTFAQLFSSVYFAKLIRQRRQDVRIVFGGNACQGAIGTMLFDHFQPIDYIVHGEGEIPLSNLIRALSQGEEAESIAGVFTKRTKALLAAPVKSQIPALDLLPTPFYGEYFERVEALRQYESFRHNLRIPIEGSRGCWRDRSHIVADTLCQFCDNNNTWKGYRTKSPSKITAEIKELSDRHQCLRVVFTDNISRIRGFQELFQSISRLPQKLSLFTEAYAHLGFEDLIALSKAGILEVQFGIEALSTPILNLMKKGTSLIKNAFVMKMCEELDMTCCSNLITYYPQVKAREIRESIDNVLRLCAYRPLHPVRFEVNLDSPIAKRPKDFGITSVSLHPIFKATIPRRLQSSLLIPPNVFTSPQLKRVAAHWNRLEHTVQWWNENRAASQKLYDVGRLLTHVQGASFLQILDFRFRRPSVLCLSGWKRDLYEYLYFPRAVKDCVALPTRIAAEEIAAELRSWYRKRLIVRDGNSVMALSVSQSRPNLDGLQDLASRVPATFRTIDRGALQRQDLMSTV